MKRTATAFAICLLTAASISTYSQEFKDAGEYMSYIGKAQSQLSTKYLGYMSAASHGKRMKVVEKRRSDVVNSIYETRVKISMMPSFNGDKSFRDSSVAYLNLMYNVFNEDYSKIVNLEEISEQSYDMMEAYVLAKQTVNQKLKEASDRNDELQKDFAKRNNVHLVDEQTELGRKLAIIGRVNDYYDKVYLIFFKANWQEQVLLDALKAKNTNAIEQSRTTLIKYSEDGLEKLKALKGFESDQSVEAVCTKALAFYKDEAEKKLPVMSDFLLSAENFEKVQKAFQGSSDKSKEKVDDYNRMVKEINKKSDNYNAINTQLNGNRTAVISSYNNSVAAFMDSHIPFAN